MTCCKTSYILCESIPSCIEQLIIQTPVISDDVTLRFLDKFGKVYYVEKESDAEGKVTVQLIRDASGDPVLSVDLPVALLNEYAGEFKIMAYDSTGDQKQWTISGSQYDALVIKVANVTPVQTIYTIDTTYAEGVSGQFNL